MSREGAGAGGISTDAAEARSMIVSYCVNLLQNLPADAPDVFVTLDSRTPPEQATVFRRLSLTQPVPKYTHVCACTHA